MTLSRNGQRDPLEARAWTRLAVQRLLATGNRSQREIAREYGVTQSAVSQFATRHAEAIAAIRADADSEFAGILLAQKTNRLAMYQQEVEAAEDRGDHKLVARLLRQMAEEMGHLPSRMQLSGTVGIQTTYTVTGDGGEPIDTEALK